METFPSVMGIIVFVLIAYLIYIDQRLLKKIVTYKRSDRKLKISDERYYELNNKFQLLSVVASIIILVGTFIGVNSITDFEKEMKIKTETINKYIEEISSIKKALTQLQIDYSFNVRTYMVSNILVPRNVIETARKHTNKKPQLVKVNFKDLRTTDGDSLPAFTRPPFINIQNLGFAFAIMIKKITLEYFEYEFGEVSTYDDKTGKEEPVFPISKFDVLITIKK